MFSHGPTEDMEDIEKNEQKSITTGRAKGKLAMLNSKKRRITLQKNPWILETLAFFFFAVVAGPIGVLRAIHACLFACDLATKQWF